MSLFVDVFKSVLLFRERRLLNASRRLRGSLRTRPAEQ